MHYIYITTNLIDGKSYIGQRKTPKGKTPYNDTYLGSGTRLLYAIKKHGKINFIKQILHECKTQEEADKLEIQEIQNRGALNNKEKFYNISGGGQFGRSDNHSELTSISMKNLYSSEKGKELILKIKKTRKENLDNEIIRKYGSISHYNNLVKMQKNKNKIKHINQRQRSYIKHINIEKIHDAKQWRKRLDLESSNRLSKGRKAAAEHKRNNNISYFKQDTKRKFAIAKAKRYNNVIALYLFNLGLEDFKPIRNSIKCICTKEYKTQSDNFYMQLDTIISYCNEQLKDNVNVNNIKRLINDVRISKGLIEMP